MKNHSRKEEKMGRERVKQGRPARKIRALLPALVLGFLFVLGGASFAAPQSPSIYYTVHNLSTSGPGAIKATSEQEVCVFCHIPHHAQYGQPLWNHNMPGPNYTMYSSNYLAKAGYTQPATLGTTASEPGFLSLECLSCHDGTVAIGGVYMVRGTILGGAVISMSGTANGYMPSGAANLGTDLSHDHPVGIQYIGDPSSYGIHFDLAGGAAANPKPMELLQTPVSPLVLFNYGQSGVTVSTNGSGYVECESCHDPHVQNPNMMDNGTANKFLRVVTDTTLAANSAATCNDCHNKIGIGTPPLGAHSATDLSSVTYPQSELGTTSASTLLCMNCHTPHNPSTSGGPQLTNQEEAYTCFRGAAGSSNEAPCHGNGATRNLDIEDVASRTTCNIPMLSTNSHYTHVDLGDLAPQSYLIWPPSSTPGHVDPTCVECHNPHQAEPGDHVTANQGPDARTGWYPTNPTNLVSPALTGVPGVLPSWSPSDWGVTTTFSTVESAQYEYQICFKCHSYYSFHWGGGENTNAGTLGTGITSITTEETSTAPAEAGVGSYLTDQAVEFNPYNKSAHPVVNTLNNQAGSYAKGLTAAQMYSPWTNVGAQTMYCSDCHGANDEPGGDPRGPHGSSNPFMLKGQNTDWPINSSTNEPFTLGDLFSGTATGLFCLNCHPLYPGGGYNGFYNNVHGNPNHYDNTTLNGGQGFDINNNYYHGIPCVSCHLAVPHGGKRSRLIGYEKNDTVYIGDIAPYNYTNASNNYSYLLIDGFKASTAGPGGYVQSNCWSTSSQCSNHSGYTAGAYDQ